MVVVTTSGLNLSTVLDKLKELDIPFDNCRRQAYDNGANMKGKKQGVQADCYNLIQGCCLFLAQLIQ